MLDTGLKHKLSNRQRILVLLKMTEVYSAREILFFDDRGQIHKQKQDEQVNLADFLNLLSNAAIVWNTVYMQAAIEELRRTEHMIDQVDFLHFCPI